MLFSLRHSHHINTLTASFSFSTIICNILKNSTLHGFSNFANMKDTRPPPTVFAFWFFRKKPLRSILSKKKLYNIYII